MSRLLFSPRNISILQTTLLFIYMSSSSSDDSQSKPLPEPEPEPEPESYVSKRLLAEPPSPKLSPEPGTVLREPIIFGGSECSVENYPFIVSILFASRGATCAGTLIFPKWVLTAAHCFSDVLSKEWPFVKIQGGSSKPVWSKPIIMGRGGGSGTYTRGQTIQIRHVFHVFFHDNSKQPHHHNDIALIQLDDEFSLNDHLYTADLPPPPSSPAKLCTKALSMGWRKKPALNASEQESNDTRHHWLRCLEFPMADSSFCGSSDAHSDNFGNISAKTLCAKYDKKGVGNYCSGHHGGPLVCKDEPDIVIGIVKADEGCDQGDETTFTRVDAYLVWIRDQIPAEVAKKRQAEQDKDQKLFLSGSGHVPAAHVLLVVLLLINCIFP